MWQSRIFREKQTRLVSLFPLDIPDSWIRRQLVLCVNHEKGLNRTIDLRLEPVGIVYLVIVLVVTEKSLKCVYMVCNMRLVEHPCQDPISKLNVIVRSCGILLAMFPTPATSLPSANWLYAAYWLDSLRLGNSETLRGLMASVQTGRLTGLELKQPRSRMIQRVNILFRTFPQ